MLISLTEPVFQILIADNLLREAALQTPSKPPELKGKRL